MINEQARTIEGILYSNGDRHGDSTDEAWDTINEEVKQGRISLQDVYKFGKTVGSVATFPNGQVGKSVDVKIEYEKIQDRLISEREGKSLQWGVTDDEVWAEFTALISKEDSKITAYDVYYFGVLAHLNYQSKFQESDGDS